ncbi:MAG: M20/M25/M40 family metallo-hydrolase [Nevskiaceae bacterium]
MRSAAVSRHAFLSLCTALSVVLAGDHTARGAEQSTLAAVSAGERKTLFRSIDAGTPRSVALLEELVNQNSGTFNVPGVTRVAERLQREFVELGFSTRWVKMDAVGRANHLVAERRGTQGKRLLLIGHMDTVFEPFSAFKTLKREGDRAAGPGVHDMKGGLVVMIEALRALQAMGALENRSITVFITAEEEYPGDPASVSRAEFIEAGKNAEAALCFESGVTIDGKDYVSTARRGATDWRLEVEGIAAHSSGMFSPGVGDGAIFEIARIIARFHDDRREPNLTFHPAMIGGGGATKLEDSGTASATGRVNIVAAQAQALGDIRALTPEQLERTKQKMQAIVGASLPQTKAKIEFRDFMPPMAPTPRNQALFAQYAAQSEAAGLGSVLELDPMQRGAGDSAWISPYVATVTGLGMSGGGSHTINETVELPTLQKQAKRAALLIRALTR